jgi:hypothetical protein
MPLEPKRSHTPISTVSVAAVVPATMFDQGMFGPDSTKKASAHTMSRRDNASRITPTTENATACNSAGPRARRGDFASGGNSRRARDSAATHRATAIAVGATNMKRFAKSAKSKVIGELISLASTAGTDRRANTTIKTAAILNATIAISRMGQKPLTWCCARASAVVDEARRWRPVGTSTGCGRHFLSPRRLDTTYTSTPLIEHSSFDASFRVMTSMVFPDFSVNVTRCT